MKNFILFLAFLLSLTATAQPFHPYKVKSGHVQYKTIRFILHSEIRTDANGKMVGKAWQEPYVSRIRDFYWEDYGDISRDVIYKVSDIGGKPLPEKKKYLERLWREGRMYYLKNGKVEFDTDHLREECMEKKLLFEKVGWFKTLYPEAQSIGKEKVAGKTGVRYKEDAFSEYVLWNGLILRNVNYYTNRAGERKREEREEVAVKVQMGIDFNPGFFQPKWYLDFVVGK
jgi:hypothetical protein